MLLPSYCHNCCLYFLLSYLLWIWLNWINAIRSFGYLPRNLMIRFARPLVICWLSLSKCCSIRVERLYLHMSSFCRGSCDRRCCTCSAEVGVLRTCDLSFTTIPTELKLHYTEILVGYSQGIQTWGNKKQHLYVVDTSHATLICVQSGQLKAIWSEPAPGRLMYIWQKQHW